MSSLSDFGSSFFFSTFTSSLKYSYALLRFLSSPKSSRVDKTFFSSSFFSSSRLPFKTGLNSSFFTGTSSTVFSSTVLMRFMVFSFFTAGVRLNTLRLSKNTASERQNESAKIIYAPTLFAKYRSEVERRPVRIPPGVHVRE